MENQKLISAVKGDNRSVNKNVKICIECGDPAIKRENYGFYCKHCGEFFNYKENVN
jgi:ribosomal protein L37AE/L43A